MEGPPPSPSVPPSILSNDLSSLSPPPSDFQSAVEFWVDLPKLSPEVLAQYKVSRETSLAYRLDEIIGEYQEGSRHWYFARYQRGIAYKFLSSELTEDLPELVEEYERRKASGVLPAFDPSAHYIHPNSRIKVMLHIKNRWGTETNASNESNFSDSDTEERETDGSGDDYGSSRGYGRRTNGRRLRSSRAGARSRMVIDTDEELEVSHRRSTRSRSTKARYTALSASMSESEYSNREPTQKKARRLKPARPAYGHVRSIEDLNAVDDGEAATLRRHRDVCEKCRQPPAHILLRGIKKRNKNKKRKRRTSPEDEFEESEEERVTSLGGWIRCLKCPVSTHWRCLAATQRQEIVKAAKAKAEKSLEQGDVHEQPHSMEIGNRLEIDQTTDFICGTCVKGGFCMYCKETVLEPDISLSSPQPPGLVQEDETGQSSAMPTKRDNDSKPRTLLFRCLTCKRLAHYHHLPNPTESTDDWNTTEKAEYYQDTTAWLCADCVSYQRPVDKIIAWRPYPPDAIEIPHLDIASLYKQPLPREYLVKWQDRSFRRTQWVPHMWLLNTHGMKLKNFLTGGTKVELVLHTTEDDAMADDASEMMSTSRASSAKPGASTPNPIAPMVDAESRIPVAWKTVDRVLDVRLWHSDRRNKRFASKYGEHDEDEQTEEPHDEGERARIYDLGEEPAPDLIEDVSKYERRLGRKLRNEDANHVVWAYIKWSDLGYEDATWDSPPRPTDPDFLEFMSAFKQFVDSRDVFVQKLTGEHLRAFDNRKKEEYRTKYVLKDASDLDLGQDPKLKLMDFQVDGFNWLSNNWWTHQHCILADEMGLGKTVQIATFLGSLVQRWKAAPALVIVPNSTITNWVREVRRWAPNLRVVPFYGETKAREVIKRYELFHEKPPAGYTAAKFHVLIATYEAVLNAKDFFVFKNQPRWEVLIVDEGQRLKNDSSLLFRKLNELKSAHRIIMTGTPLNNNMRELFNLMNFLDPVEWSDLANLEKEYEELTEDLIKQLHQRLRPYFLRRVKSEVLKLPPKNEVIVPVTMTELQKQVYKSLLGE
ncbi:hypothetical protein AX16_009731 [Volvariella volvacea WC 439]|nr:hypothetical protein AX16_009731 [Volvariella volvacea WC 439]